MLLFHLISQKTNWVSEIGLVSGWSSDTLLEALSSWDCATLGPKNKVVPGTREHQRRWHCHRNWWKLTKGKMEKDESFAGFPKWWWTGLKSKSQMGRGSILAQLQGSFPLFCEHSRVEFWWGEGWKHALEFSEEIPYNKIKNFTQQEKSKDKKRGGENWKGLAFSKVNGTHKFVGFSRETTESAKSKKYLCLVDFIDTDTSLYSLPGTNGRSWCKTSGTGTTNPDKWKRNGGGWVWQLPF